MAARRNSALDPESSGRLSEIDVAVARLVWIGNQSWRFVDARGRDFSDATLGDI